MNYPLNFLVITRQRVTGQRQVVVRWVYGLADYYRAFVTRQLHAGSRHVSRRERPGVRLVQGRFQLRVHVSRNQMHNYLQERCTESFSEFDTTCCATCVTYNLTAESVGRLESHSLLLCDPPPFHLNSLIEPPFARVFILFTRYSWLLESSRNGTNVGRVGMAETRNGAWASFLSLSNPTWPGCESLRPWRSNAMHILSISRATRSTTVLLIHCKTQSYRDWNIFNAWYKLSRNPQTRLLMTYHTKIGGPFVHLVRINSVLSPNIQRAECASGRVSFLNARTGCLRFI